MAAAPCAVFFYEAFEEERETLKKFLPKELNARYTSNTIQEGKDSHPPAPVISTRTQSIIPLLWSARLQGVLTRSTGYDHLTRYRTETKTEIPLGYLPYYCSRAVAEQALLLWTALLRQLPRQMAHMKSFDRNGLTGGEMRGKTLLVVGVGNIGHEIVTLGTALGMKTFGVDINEKHRDVNYTTLEKGVPQADIIVCAMNLTDKNFGYFNYEVLAGAKSSALFINVSRGEFASVEDLLRLLTEGRLDGVGLDVYPSEGELAVELRANKGITGGARALLELAKHPRAILTPHNAFNTKEALEQKAEQSARQITAFIESGQFLWPLPETL